MAKNGNRQAALARARQRRRELDRERDAQDERIEEATASAFVALDARQQADAEVAAASAELGVAVRSLMEENVSPERAADLLQIEVHEVRRVSKLEPPTAVKDGGRQKPAAAARTRAAVKVVPSPAGEGEDAARRAG